MAELIYANHPWLEGFRDKPDSELLDAAIAQMDYAAWVAKGAKFGKEGLASGVVEEMRARFSDAPRAGLEKLLYHAILAAITEDQKARSGKDSRVPQA